MVGIVAQVQISFYYSEARAKPPNIHQMLNMGINFCKVDVQENGLLNINAVRPRCSSQRH